MRTSLGTLAFLFAACASPSETTANASASARVDDLGLAPVSAPLVLPPGAREVSLAWLVDELARLTGQELVFVPEERERLEALVEPLEATSVVPADEVYAFVESLLVFHGYVLARLKEGTPTMLAVVGPGSGRSSAEVPYVPLEIHDRDALARHPALLFQHAVHFENLDSRQLQTQLRQLLVDPTGHCNVVPAGERSLIFQGYGLRLRSLMVLLAEIDEASAVRPVAQTQAEQPPPGR